MSTVPGNALVEDIVSYVFDFVSEYNIGKDGIEDIAMDHLREYAEEYKLPELVSPDVEDAVMAYIKKRNKRPNSSAYTKKSLSFAMSSEIAS